ncbi:TPA: 3-hydroxyacyl-CoA dehydrogenase family protein [Candidatus Poribacteria bacterium]|nr:3-hydroxyacyl-CoA dehydrogenase family protein [Candidatus Poribacteria bacterium]
MNEIKKVAVLGAGVMGHGIALSCARAGYPTVIRDIDEKILEQAFERIKASLNNLAKFNIISSEKVKSTMSLISGTVDLNKAVSDANIVFEAIPEKLDLKKEVFQKLDEICAQDTILASNTSSFRITDIASSTKNPSRVVGAHWANPPYLLPLVEIIKGEKTSEETIKLTKDFLEKIGKRPIVCKKDTPGFIVNRIQAAVSNLCIHLVEDGLADPEDIDTVWESHIAIRYCATGPLKVIDFFGADLSFKVRSNLYNQLKDPLYKPPKLLEELVNKGELGIKTGKGIYDYKGKDIGTILDERDQKLINVLIALKLIK